MIKKIFLISLSFSIIFYNASFAANPEEKCLIKNKTPDFLRNYIKNVQKIEKNINTQLYHLKMPWPNWKLIPAFDYRWLLEINPTQRKDWESLVPFVRWEFFKISDRITYFFNEAFDWNAFKAETYYYLQLAIFQEIPPSITRDFSILKRESERIDKTLNYLIRHWFYNWKIDLDKLCNQVTWICKFPNAKNIWDSLTILKANNDKIINIIISSLEWDLAKKVLPIPQTTVWWDLFFVEKDFLDQVAKYYNSYTMTDCSINWWKWWFSWFKDAWKKIKKAVENWKISEDAVSEWKDAIELAKWMPNEERKYEEIEKKLLKKELSRQGLSTNASNAILNNLKRFNEKWFYSMENNFIVNTINYWIKNIKREVDRFNVFWEWITRFKKDVLPPTIFADATIKLSNSIWIEKEINRIYEHAEPYLLVQTEQEEKIKAQFREAYLNLKTAIFNLNEVESMACKICESQMVNITNDFCCPANSIIR